MKDQHGIEDRPTVLMIGPYPPPYGGVATVIKSLSQQEVILRGYNVSVYQIGRRKASTSFARQFYIDFINIIKFPFTREFRSSAIVHIHTASYWSFFRSIPYVMLSKFISRSKVVLHIHGAEFHLFYKKSSALNKYIIRKILGMSDSIIVTSASWIEVINSILGDSKRPIFPIPNGFEAKTFFPRPIEECRERLSLPKNKKILVTIGHLEEYKGHKYLIDAIKSLGPKKNDIAVYIIGKGSLESALAEQITRNDLKGCVILAGGNKPDDEIPIWMNACDIFVLPSLNEGNPTVMFEALGCKKPFVGSRVGGVPDVIVSDRYGLLAEPANSQDLAEKIGIALDKEWDHEAIGRYALQFNWEDISKRIVDIYDSTINGGQGALRHEIDSR